MFTGIVRELGKIINVEPKKDVVTWEIEAGFIDELKLGASVMTHGVCLTVTELLDRSFKVDIVPETLRCTMLQKIKVGDFVHLEPSLRLQDTVDGHFVMGHVDTVVKLKAIHDRDEYELELELPEKYRQYIAQKGSVSLNGVSLTVADTTDSTFTVALIPETLKRTTFSSLKPGSTVNVEIDMVARYLEHMLKLRVQG